MAEERFVTLQGERHSSAIGPLGWGGRPDACLELGLDDLLDRFALNGDA